MLLVEPDLKATKNDIALFLYIYNIFSDLKFKSFLILLFLKLLIIFI